MSAMFRNEDRSDDIIITEEDIISHGFVQISRFKEGVPFSDEKKGFVRFRRDWSNFAELRKSYKAVSREASEAGSITPFLWNRDFGYITPIAGEWGTNLLIQADFHLEALYLLRDLDAITKALNAVRIAIIHPSSEERHSNPWGSILALRNDAMLGLSEEGVMSRVRNVYLDLVRQEINARYYLVENLPHVYLDAVERALALLRSARLLTEDEVLDLISPIRMAVNMGFIDGLTREQVFNLTYEWREKMVAPCNLESPKTAEEEAIWDKRTTNIARTINKMFRKIKLNDYALERLS